MSSSAASIAVGDGALVGNRQRDAGRRAGEVVELEIVARIAFGEIVEPDAKLIAAGFQRDPELGGQFEISLIGSHPPDLAASDEQDGTPTGAKAQHCIAR